MKPFNIRMDTETFNRAKDLGKTWGIRSIAGFIRFAIAKFPYTDVERSWTDMEMKEFARRWAGRKENKPGVLEDPAIQMEREFRNFKQDFLTSK